MIINEHTFPTKKEVYGDYYKRGKIRIGHSQTRGGLAIFVSGYMRGPLFDSEDEAIEFLLECGVEEKRICK